MDFQVKLFTQIPFPYSLHQRHGHTYQAHGWASKLPTICTMSAQNIRTINTSKDYGVEPTRLPGMEYFCGKGFITTDGDTWSQSRKLLKPSFDYNNIKDITILQEEVDKLIKQLPKDGSVIDFQPLLYIMFLNSALYFVLGVHPSDQLTRAPLTANEFVQYFHKSLVYSIFRTMLGRAWSLVPQGGYKRTCTIAHNFLDYCIVQAEGKSLRSRSLIQGLLAYTDDPTYIRSQCLTNALFLLARHPQYWQQLRDEFLNKPESALSAESLLRSKCLHNILYETKALRLYPIFPLISRKALHDTQLPTGGGPNHDRPIFVPQRSMVVMSYYALHRDPDMFGDDVEAFRPERWDHIKPTQWEFLGFGDGNRACLGQQKAVIEASPYWMGPNCIVQRRAILIIHASQEQTGTNKPKGTVVLTGANGGLGNAVVSRILSQPELRSYHGVSAVRDASFAAALHSILENDQGHDGEHRLHHTNDVISLDLARLDSVRQTAAAINERVKSGDIPPIRALILNAAYLEFEQQTWTDDGFDTAFAVAYLGHWLLAILLLESLDRDHGRIVVIGSSAHDTKDPRNNAGAQYIDERWHTIFHDSTEPIAKGTWSTLKEDSLFRSGYRRYGAAKLCQVMIIPELQRRIDKDPVLHNISVVGIDPGSTPTTLVRRGDWRIRGLWTSIMPWLVVILTWLWHNGTNRTTAKSSRDILAAALDTSPVWGEKPKGLYLDGEIPKDMAAEARDPKKREQLWQDTLNYTGLSGGETVLANWQ
ncbi:putative short-chain dehydrogenase [Seiridium cupressi]